MRFYIDTSVFGGYFDEHFQEDTCKLFRQIEDGDIFVVISDLSARELLEAPLQVRDLIQLIPKGKLDIISINDEIMKLAEWYVKEGTLTKKFISDAQHIAAATMARVDALISWNFRHMVNFFRVRQYNSVNLKYGYTNIDIRSPREVLYET